MKFTGYKNTSFKKYLRKIFVEEYLKEGEKVYSRHFDEIFNDKKIYRKSWLKLTVILLEELHKICEEKNIKGVELVVYMHLKSKKHKIGINFKNEKELINEFIHWRYTPNLGIRSFKIIENRKFKKIDKNRKFKKIKLEDFSDPKISLFFIEEPPNQWDDEFNRLVFLKLND